MPESGQTPEMDTETAEELLEECEVTTFRGSGPGGQHRNRRESGVRLVHRPTGIVVVATERRSQHRNRAVALERLASRLAELRRPRKPRRATRPTAASKKRRVDEKKKRSETKRTRGRVGGSED